jgi:antitoxin (DNA-binding transcriptional repressor) of toxin-antitoxin stability system
MKSIDLANLTALEPFIQPGSTDPVLVTSHGQTIAAVVPVASDDDLEDLILARSQQFNAILQRSQERLEKEGGLGTDEVRRRLGLPGS